MESSRQKSPSTLERHEAKYIIPQELVPRIRAFLQPFVVRDPHGQGPFPEYQVVTLQLDGPGLPLYRAKEDEALHRFKLRIRTYNDPEQARWLFLEIKRKHKSVVVKSRTRIPANTLTPGLFAPRAPAPTFHNETERAAFYEFVRLLHAVGARPQLLIRYRRESYFGAHEDYARVTFDRQMSYQPTRRWSLVPPATRWWRLDSATALNRPYSGVVLELKTDDEVPGWMVDLVERFNLTRVGFCKYAAAVRLESLFSGAAYAEGSEPVHAR